MTDIHEMFPGMFQRYDPTPAAPAPSPVETRKRAVIWRASGGRCGICGCRIKNLLAVTIDHVVPRSKGGKNHNNRVAAHKGCNMRKANRMPTGCERIWLAVVNARLAD